MNPRTPRPFGKISLDFYAYQTELAFVACQTKQANVQFMP